MSRPIPEVREAIPQDTIFHCPVCGMLNEPQLALYLPELFNAHSLRFGPWCVRCGRRALVMSDRLDAAPGQTFNAPMLFISGSCASGKSTVSHLLAHQYGYVQIDGDWILHRRRTEAGRPVEFSNIDEELLAMAAGMTALGKPVVIAQVILPAQMALYDKFCGRLGILWQAAVLMPQEEELLERNRTRKCWPKTTPEYWVKHFHAQLLGGPPAFARWYYDNSHETAEETAEKLWQRMVGVAASPV